MEPTYLFLDCEWADTLGIALVSLALISMDGEQRFYAERDPVPDRPTDFVRKVVYPLLDRSEHALPDAEFAARLRAFIARIPAPRVVFDHPNDGVLLRRALAGLDVPQSQIGRESPTPLDLHLTRDKLVAMLLEDWFYAHPDAARRRHHALVDAEALRQAWCAATGRTTAPWSPVGDLLLGRSATTPQ